MLALALLLLGCASLHSNALPALVQYQAKDELGQYSYGYSGGPSAKREERTLDGVTRGSYSYIDGNGIVQTRAYEADDLHGFRVVGTDISAPSGVSRSGTILSSTGLPVSDYTPLVKTYQPISYLRSGYDNIQSISGNEISISPNPYSVRKTITPYSSALEYLKSPYQNRVLPQPTKYYKQHYISPNSLEVSPLSSVGIRVPTTSYSRPIPPIAYSDSLAGVQSTVTPPSIYANEVIPATVATPVQTVSIQESSVPVRASYTPTYQTDSSQIVSSYVPKNSVSLQSIGYGASPIAASAISYRPNVVAITNPNPAPISYLDAAPGPISISSTAQPTVAISNPSPTVVAYTKAVPAAAVTYATASPPTVAVYNSAPAVNYASSAPAVSYTSSAPAVSYTGSVPALSYTSSAPAVSYISSAPAVSYTSAAPAISYATAAPAISYASAAPAVSYTSAFTPLSYGYYPTTSNIVRYASEAPSVRATIYEPAGGYIAAKPVPLQEAIATQYHAQDELGQYRYGYANVNSAKEEAKTIDGVTRGSFSYIDANGVLQSRSYVSDDINGFRVIGTDIPKDPNGHVNPDAIPSEHVAPSVSAAISPPVATFHSQQVAAVSTLPVLSHDTVEVNAPFVVSSTPATLNILK